ncbi:MAG: Uncharacterised protein [Pseudidiomarina mangrovi]|nr:MAG: Uncharacterised protein [Pseudidiomarina mangrovi]
MTKTARPTVLFIHGMGRSSLSAWPMLRELSRNGFITQRFDYFVSLSSFAQIKSRLKQRIVDLATAGDYILVGHSLGGVLIRAALNDLPVSVRLPRHVYLLGSPMRSSLLAKKLRPNPLFRLLTGDCGALLGSDKRMQMIGSLTTPTSAIIGARTIALTRRIFQQQPNDGVVTQYETSASWFQHEIELPLIHSVLPSSTQIARLISADFSNATE